MKSKIIDNIKTIIYALIIAIIIRTLLFQPFYIPSSSMEPNLLVGDRLFVSKYTYGYSRHSFPFSPNLSNKRFFYEEPKRGDVVVFKTPVDDRTDYIKRLIGLPGDSIQFIDGSLYINGLEIKKDKVSSPKIVHCGNEKMKVLSFKEVLPNGVSYTAVYRNNSGYSNSDLFLVPNDHFFFLGDNRDCSKDSRFLGSVGYVNKRNLVGKARIIFFSNDKNFGNILKFWKLHNSLRIDRFFKKIK